MKKFNNSILVFLISFILTVCNHGLFGNSITLNLPLNGSTVTTPMFYYPLNNTTIKSNRITFRGESSPSSKVFIYESDVFGENGLLVGTTISNEECQWAFESPINESGTKYYTAKIINVQSGNTSILYSDQITIILEKSTLETFIETPENYDEIITPFFNITGYSKENSIVDIYFESNTEGESSATSNNTILKTLLTTTSSNVLGEWNVTAQVPTNNDYLITAVASTSNYRSTSNSVAIKVNYDFDLDDLVIESPVNGSTTNKSIYTISGRSPNGVLNLFINDVLINQINVIDKSWEVDVNLQDEKEYVFHTTINHNGLTKISEKIELTRDSTPKITETSSSLIFNKIFVIKGTGREKTLLTVTVQETSLGVTNSSIFEEAIASDETIIGQVLTNEDGYWEIELPMNRPGNYIFTIYENFNEENEVSSESYNYDLAINSFNISLDVAPNPFNPTNDTLKIQYILSEPSDVSIEIYNISGQQVFSESLTAGMSGTSTGRHFIEWDGTLNTERVHQGLYIVILNINNSNTVKTKRLGIKW